MLFLAAIPLRGAIRPSGNDRGEGKDVSAGVPRKKLASRAQDAGEDNASVESSEWNVDRKETPQSP